MTIITNKLCKVHLVVSCLGRHYEPNWRPRHRHYVVPCLTLALSSSCCAVSGPCFFEPCSHRLIVLVPNDHLDRITNKGLAGLSCIEQQAEQCSEHSIFEVANLIVGPDHVLPRSFLIIFTKLCAMITWYGRFMRA
jgi:hypothetical protein